MREYKGIPVVPMSKFTKETGITISKCQGKMHGERSITTSWTSTPICQANIKAANMIVDKLIADGKSLEDFEDKIPVCYWCYAKGSSFARFPAIRKAYEKNTYILDKGILKCLPDFDARREITPVRYSTHGDLSSENCLRNYCLIAEANPKTRFVLLTKHRSLCSKYFKENPKPHNLYINLSSFFVNNPNVNSLEKEYWIDNIFTVYEANYANDNHIKANCKCYKGSCKDCQRCAKANNVDRCTVEILRK